MPSRFHTNDKTILVDNYDNALDVTKQKLYAGSTTSIIGTEYSNWDR